MFMFNIAAALSCIIALAPSAFGATTPFKRTSQSIQEPSEAPKYNIRLFVGPASNLGCSFDLSQTWAYLGVDNSFLTDSYDDADCWTPSTEQLSDGIYTGNSDFTDNQTINSFGYRGLQTKIYFFSSNSCGEEDLLGSLLTGNHTEAVCFDTKDAVEDAGQSGLGIKEGWKGMKVVLLEE